MSRTPAGDVRPATLPAALASPADADALIVCYARPVATTDDTPLALDLAALATSLASTDGPRLIAIEGIRIDDHLCDLPGLRVGPGAGCGNVFARELDGRLMFSPDAGFSGIAQFECTIADAGRVVQVVATVEVECAHASLPEITFADGSNYATVPVGAETAIIGALSIDGLTRHGAELRVYEPDSSEPSSRFAVESGRLHALQPLFTESGSTIFLKIAAYDAAFQFAASDFAIELLPTPHTASEDEASRPRLACVARLDAAALDDHFIFSSVDEPLSVDVDADASDIVLLEAAAYVSLPCTDLGFGAESPHLPTLKSVSAYDVDRSDFDL